MANLKVSGTNFFTLMNAKEGKIGHNTYLHHGKDYDTGEHFAAITLHDTVIVRVFEDRIEYNTGGYNTVTTKERMNQFALDGQRVYQKDFQWYVNGQPVGREWTVPRFASNMQHGYIYAHRPLNV